MHFFNKDGVQVIFVMSHAAGIVEKSKVKFMGIEVGEVSSVELVNNVVEVHAVLNTRYHLPDNVISTVSQDGLVGEKFLELLTPRDEPLSNTYIVANGRYDRSRQQFSMDDLTMKINEIAEQIETFVTTVNDMLKKERGSISEIIENIRSTTETLQDLLKSERNNISEIVRNVEITTEALRDIVNSERDSVSEIVENTRATTEVLRDIVSSEQGNISEIIKNARVATETLNDILNSERNNISEIVENTKTVTETLRDILNSERDNVSAVVDNIQVTSEVLKDIITSNQDEITRIINNISKVSDTLESASRGRDKDVDIIVENLKELSENLNNFSKEIESILQSEKGKLTDTMEDIRNVAGKANDVMDNINNITADVAAGKGAVGLLLSDNETRTKVKETIDSLSVMLKTANDFTIELEAGLEDYTRYGEYHGNFLAKVRPNNQNYYLLGVSNTPFGTTENTLTHMVHRDVSNPSADFEYFEKKTETEENKLLFSLQYARIFQDMFTIRGGLIESSIGFGVDVKPFEHHNLYLTLEASNFFRETYGTYGKFNAKYYFLDNFFVQTGWDDLFSSRSSYSVGVGVNFIDNDIKYLLSSVPLPTP
jgi:phospholipid/cholesterol/gamma-HCH transport system substrate-binding protein